MELFDFGIPALDKALNLTATVLLLLALGMLLIRVILRLCDRAFDRSERLAPFRTYLHSTLRAVLYILLALAVLGSIGVEITSFVALLSVAGLAVSLSLQNTLSNVAGGVMLLISKPFTVGDYVSCDGIEGAVRAVDLAYTTFTTVDNKEISLQKLAQYEEGSDEYKEAFAYEQQIQWSNKAVNEAYEPGSVFKVITTATALETGAVTMQSSFNCTGSYVAGGIVKHCWKHAGHGLQTLAQAMQNSCNPAYMQIGERIGGTNFYNFFTSFGLTETTGIDLPGEESGYFYSEAQLNSTQGNLETASFGQSFKVTPIQLITAISASVNGGYLYEPYVVDKVLDSEGNVVSVTEPTIRRQVISEETSRQVCKLMEGVVTYGSGKNAAVPGYSIGGKTGTSEKLDSDRGYYTYSFVGVAPMDDPKVAVLLILDEPYETDLYGSTVAAPVVGAILSEILPYMGVETNYTAAELATINVTVPNAVGQSAHMGMAAMTQKQLSAVIVGGGDTVIAQVPASGSVIQKGSTVILYTDQESQEQKAIVPDVRGKTGQVVNTILTNAGLNLDADGIGRISDTAVAIEQSIEPGTEVPRGTLITVKFSNSVKQEASP